MDKGAPQPNKGTADRLLGKLRLPAALCLAGTLTLGCYYFFFVQNKYNYLTGRDFRFLATIGTQLESSLLTRSRLLENQIDVDALKNVSTPEERTAQLRGNLETFFETVNLVDPPEPIPGFEKPRLFLKRASHETWVHAFYTVPVKEKKKPLLHSSFKLQSLAEPLFRSRKAFDAVLLADSNGKVVYSQGDRDLSVTSLNLLLDKSNSIKTRFKKDSVNPGRFLHGSSESYSVELNGREYRLFVEPVNLPLHGLKESDGAVVPTVNGNTVWLVCGLAPKKEFLYKSMATSSALLSTLMGLLLLAALSWPFLKLILISESQRVSVFDVLLLGVCTILGISVATLFLLHLWYFEGLKEDSKYQLEAFARNMESNIRTEIVAAYKVMRALEPEALKTAARRPAGTQGVNEENLLTRYPGAFKEYPLAQTFMLMNKDGGQVYRGTVNKKATPRFPVRERAYFKRALSRNLWDIHALGDGGAKIPETASNADHTFYIESVVGWSSGIRLAMISKSLHPDISKEDSAPKVAGLAIPMISIVDPVLPPGFKFAVLDSEDENGRVLFHSDSERNLTEDFLVETDRDRRLRSAVLARRAETMMVRYWGEDYLARVAPVRGLPWTIVVLKDMRIPRAVDVSWTSTTLLLLLLYTGALIALVAMILGARPSYRAEWVWPDPQSLPEYRQLIAVYLLLITGSALAIWEMHGSPQLLGAVFVFPALALVLTYLKLHKKYPGRGIAMAIGLIFLIALANALSQAYSETDTYSAFLMISFILAASAAFIAGRPFPNPWTRDASKEPPAEGADSVPPRSATEGLDWRSVAVPYRLAGGLLLLLITVLPTMGFFKISYQLHSVSLLRHGQLKLALEMKKRANRASSMVDKVASASQKECLRKQRLAVAGFRVTGPPVAPCTLKEELKGLDIYAGAFYGTHIALPSMFIPATCRADCRCPREDDPKFLPEVIEGLLPRSSEPATEMRGFLHASASDCSWHWSEKEGSEPLSYWLHSQDYPGGGIHLTSNPRQPLPTKKEDAYLASMVEGLLPSGLVSLLFLGILAGLVTLVILFISKRIFLIDLVEPLCFEKNDESPATIGRNLFLVGKSRSWQEDDQKFFRLRIVDLEDPEKGWPARRSELLASKGVILVDGFGHRLRDPEFNLKKLTLLEELVGLQERTVVVISAVSPALLFSRERADKTVTTDSSPLSMERRWRNLLSLFTIAEDDLQGFLRRAQDSSDIQSEVLRAECGFHSHLLPIARDLDRHRHQFSDEQILEEFGERAEGYYQALWASCSSEEQLVIEHLAEERLVNEKNRRVIRRLMARGFIRREPNFKLMNETFRRFVISSSHKAEVLAIEREAAPSAWDRLRTPLFTGLAASIIFFLATQQELLDGLAASLTGVTAGLPAILRLLHVFGGNRPDLSRLVGTK